MAANQWHVTLPRSCLVCYVHCSGPCSGPRDGPRRISAWLWPCSSIEASLQATLALLESMISSLHRFNYKLHVANAVRRGLLATTKGLVSMLPFSLQYMFKMPISFHLQDSQVKPSLLRHGHAYLVILYVETTTTRHSIRTNITPCAPAFCLRPASGHPLPADWLLSFPWPWRAPTTGRGAG